MKLNRFIDHTLLKPTTTLSAVEELCREALKFDLYEVCVPPCYVVFAKKALKNSEVKIASVIGFPWVSIPRLLKLLKLRML